MTSPLVRAWLAARLPDWADHAYACWRGLLHSVGLTDREWDPCEIDPLYTDLPGLGGSSGAEAPALHQAGEPRFHTMLPCPVCNAGVGKDCVTADRTVTGPHKARREAAAAQQVTS